MKIILGICGSISAYKAHDLTRALVNEKHEVVVVLTRGAQQFVLPQVFKYLGAKAVYTELDDFQASGVLHVELARWADKFVIAPLSANTLSRLVEARANDLLTSLFLAYEKHKPIIIFPAMNSEMLTHPFVEENFEKLKRLSSLSHLFISPTNSGILACNDQGHGKLAAVDEMVELIDSIEVSNLKTSKKVVITTGATIAPLDPVRFLTNSSSGITGFYLAKSFLKLGYSVTVIAGIHSTLKLDLLKKHPHFTLIRTTTVNDMYDRVHQAVNNADYFLAAAAVTDIEFNYNEEKLKKDKIENNLPVKHSRDILKSVIELKKSELKIIGFAAETDLSDEVLNKKFQSKPVDLLVGTKVNNGTNGKSIEGFNNQHAYYRFKNKASIVFEGELAKEQLGPTILRQLESKPFN